MGKTELSGEPSIISVYLSEFKSGMSILSQFFLSVLANVSVSFLVCVICSVFLLSSGIMLEPFGPIKNPLSFSFTIGAVIGIIHGLITSAVVYWYKPDSIIGGGISTVIATEILLFIAVLIFIYFFFLKENPRAVLSFYNFGLFAYMGFNFFLILSAIFLIPSFLIGLFTWKMQEFVISKFTIT